MRPAGGIISIGSDGSCIRTSTSNVVTTGGNIKTIGHPDDADDSIWSKLPGRVQEPDSDDDHHAHSDCDSEGPWDDFEPKRVVTATDMKEIESLFGTEQADKLDDFSNDSDVRFGTSEYGDLRRMKKPLKKITRPGVAGADMDYLALHTPNPTYDRYIEIQRNLRRLHEINEMEYERAVQESLKINAPDSGLSAAIALSLLDVNDNPIQPTMCSDGEVIVAPPKLDAREDNL